MRCAPANAVEKVIWKVACTWFPDPVRELPEETEQMEFARVSPGTPTGIGPSHPPSSPKRMIPFDLVSCTGQFCAPMKLTSRPAMSAEPF
jgi:hypothetical protein